MSSGSGSLSDPPAASNNTFAWAIIPVVFVFATILASLFVYCRRRRRGYETQPSVFNRPAANRRTAQNTAQDEGLNELGEAPPPYKRQSTSSDTEDLEAGMSPPDYPAVPAPAVLPESRRDA